MIHGYTKGQNIIILTAQMHHHENFDFVKRRVNFEKNREVNVIYRMLSKQRQLL